MWPDVLWRKTFIGYPQESWKENNTECASAHGEVYIVLLWCVFIFLKRIERQSQHSTYVIPWCMILLRTISKVHRDVWSYRVDVRAFPTWHCNLYTLSSHKTKRCTDYPRFLLFLKFSPAHVHVVEIYEQAVGSTSKWCLEIVWCPTFT